MIRITKGDITLECEDLTDLKLALGVLTECEAAVVPSVYLPIDAAAPDWRVGGPADIVKPADYAATAMGDLAASFLGKADDKPALSLVQSESSDSVGLQHIPVSAVHYETLECIMVFAEGVPATGISQLLGVKVGTVHSRLQALKHQGLVERVRGHQLWVATPLARRAKLVKT